MLIIGLRVVRVLTMTVNLSDETKRMLIELFIESIQGFALYMNEKTLRRLVSLLLRHVRLSQKRNITFYCSRKEDQSLVPLSAHLGHEVPGVIQSCSRNFE